MAGIPNVNYQITVHQLAGAIALVAVALLVLADRGFRGFNIDV